MTRPRSPFWGPRRWWHELDDDRRKRVVDSTVHATIALFAIGSFVLCVIALLTL